MSYLGSTVLDLLIGYLVTWIILNKQVLVQRRSASDEQMYDNVEVRFSLWCLTFNNISVILWQSVLLVEEIRVSWENQEKISLRHCWLWIKWYTKDPKRLFQFLSNQMIVCVLFGQRQLDSHLTGIKNNTKKPWIFMMLQWHFYNSTETADLEENIM